MEKKIQTLSSRPIDECNRALFCPHGLVEVYKGEVFFFQIPGVCDGCMEMVYHYP